MEENRAADTAPPHFEATPYPSEGVLRALVLLVAALIWALLVASVIGLLAMAVWWSVRAMRLLARAARTRGDGVRARPDRFPWVYERVGELCQALEIERPPSVYVVDDPGHRGGPEAIEAYGQRLLRVPATWLERWRADTRVHDFWVAHELAAFREGHLSWRGFLAPGLWVPGLAGAYTRACVYTRDRLAAAATRMTPAALSRVWLERSVGEEAAHDVPFESFVAQRADGQGVAALLGDWLTPVPSLLRRAEALDPERFAAAPGRASAGTRWVAAGILASGVGAGVLVLGAVGSRFASRAPGPVSIPAIAAPAAWDASAQVEDSLVSLAAAAEAYRGEVGSPPPDGDVLYQTWQRLHPGEPLPIDPYDEQRYGYNVEDDRYVIWSAGPDSETEADDISYFSAETPGGVGSVSRSGTP